MKASDADTIGATALLQAAPMLTGSGVAILQPEADVATNTFETNPAATSYSPSIFTYINSSGSIANTFPNSVGSDSWHADIVAGNLSSIAPGISSLDNYDANFYYSNVIVPGVAPASINPALHNGQIVNQSWIFTGEDAPGIAQINQQFDSYAAQYNVLFVSAAGNSVSPPAPPSTAYNGLCVNAYSLSPATSAAAGGRALPDITAPGGETSYSTPYVTAGAALLLQAADLNQGGTGTATNASDIRVLKALLLNGAVKPSDWSHTNTQPLDPVYGSGMLNVYQSWLQLTAGNQTVSASSAIGQLQGPVNLRLSSGWDLGSLPNGTTINHYFFTAPSSSSGSDAFTGTIDWNVTNWDSNNNALFNNVDLALYDATTNTPVLVGISDSTLDNLQQVYATNLVPGDIYDLRVSDASTTVNGGAESYGLAYAATSGLSVVPEPSTAALLLVSAASGMAVLAWQRRKRLETRPGTM